MAWNWQPVKQEQEAARNWNWQSARVAEQTVLDDDTRQVYRAPVTFDEQDIRFAIATQVNKEPKRDFIGKVRYAAGEAWNWAEKFSDRVESGFQSAERGIVGLGGQALDTFLHASLSVPERTEQIEKYKSGDFSDWDASLNGRVTDEDIANETDPALKAAMQFRKDRQDALIAKAEERLEQRQRIRRKLDASVRKWQEVLRPEAEMDGYDRFMEAMGSGAASVGLSVATLAATKNPQVAAGIMAGVFGRMRYTDVFDKSIEKGLDYATADDYATIAGTIEGGIELALGPFLYGAANLRPVRKITDEMISRTVAKLNATAAGKSAARKIVSKHRQSVGKQGLKAGVIEGGEEALQDMGGAYFENYTGLENTPQEEIMARALMSFTVGGLLGAGTAAVGTSVYNREAAATNDRIKQSLTQAYPELTTEEKQKTADALQEIFYQDGEGRMLDELELLADKENDPDTLESGKHEISEDMRSILKKRYQMSDEEIDRTAEVAVASIDLRNQFNEAQTAFYDGLVNAGVKPNVAEPFSRLMAARASAVAINEKKTVKDVLERWNLKFERKIRPIDYNALLDDEILFQSETYDSDGKADANRGTFDPGNDNIVSKDIIDEHEVIDNFDENAPDNAFVRTKEGCLEHGYITDDLAKQLGSPKGGEIRLYNDLDKHINKDRKQYILSQGYTDLIDFVDDTITNWDKIYKGRDESYLITKSKGKDNIVAVKLEQDGKYYKISTAIISRKDYLKNKKTLAERAQSNQLLTKSPSAISGTSDIYNIASKEENVNSSLRQGGAGRRARGV